MAKPEIRSRNWKASGRSSWRLKRRGDEKYRWMDGTAWLKEHPELGVMEIYSQPEFPYTYCECVVGGRLLHANVNRGSLNPNGVGRIVRKHLIPALLAEANGDTHD